MSLKEATDSSFLPKGKEILMSRPVGIILLVLMPDKLFHLQRNTNTSILTNQGGLISSKGRVTPEILNPKISLSDRLIWWSTKWMTSIKRSKKEENHWMLPEGEKLFPSTTERALSKEVW
jgi:hypothetical protein